MNPARSSALGMDESRLLRSYRSGGLRADPLNPQGAKLRGILGQDDRREGGKGGENPQPGALG